MHFTLVVRSEAYKISLFIPETNKFWLLSQLICDTKCAAAVHDEQIDALVKRATTLDLDRDSHSVSYAYTHNRLFH